MKKILGILFCLSLVTFTVLKAVEPNTALENNKDETVQAKAVMNNVYDSFVKIIPYVYSDKNAIDDLKSSGAQRELIKNLTDISNSFKGARHVEYFQKPGFRPSLETINSHLDETISSIKSQNYIFAQSRLKALTALCVSCHSSLSESVSKNAFGEAINREKRSRFVSDYAFANYLFLVRRFTEAIFYFEQSLKNHLDTGPETDSEKDHEVYSSFRRVLSIDTKITFRPESAIIFLKKYQDNKNLSPQLKETILQWILSLDKWKKFDPKKIKSLHSYIAKYLAPLEAHKEKLLSGESDVTLLISSGILSKYLTDHPKSPMAPELLYWMAIVERRLSTTYFFSLSDLYLKDCITVYSKSPFARKCYQEYEDNITFGFSGSKGTDIPEEEKHEMERLKRFLK